MILEFAGLPASGKSTAAELLLELAARKGATAYLLPLDPRGRTKSSGWWLTRLAHQAALFAARAVTLLRYPTMARAVTTALRSSRRSTAEKWFALRHTVVTAHALRHARKGSPRADLVVAAEGICQRAFSLFVDGNGVGEHRTVEQFIDGAPRPDAVVVLRVTPRVAHERVQARGYGPLSYRFDGLTPAELIDRFAEGQRLLLEAAAHLGTHGQTRIIVLEADDLAQVREQLAVLLPSILPQTRSSGA